MGRLLRDRRNASRSSGYDHLEAKQNMNTPGLTRRGFLQLSAGSVGALGIKSSKDVSLVTDPGDAVATSAPVIWAAQELEQAPSSCAAQITGADVATASPGSVTSDTSLDDLIPRAPTDPADSWRKPRRVSPGVFIFCFASR